MMNLGRALEIWSNVIIREFKKQLAEDGAIASRKLTQSIRPEIKLFGTTYVMEIKMEDYWKEVDKGQKPGTKPDVQKILKWMRHKGIQPAPSKLSFHKPRSSRAKKVYKDRRLALAERIANAIYRKGTIKRFGYKGTGFVSDYTATLTAKMRDSIARATGKDIAIEIKEAFK